MRQGAGGRFLLVAEQKQNINMLIVDYGFSLALLLFVNFFCSKTKSIGRMEEWKDG